MVDYVKCISLINILKRDHDFFSATNFQQYYGFSRFIGTSINLSDVELKLFDIKYPSLAHFIRDVRRPFVNALKFRRFLSCEPHMCFFALETIRSHFNLPRPKDHNLQRTIMEKILACINFNILEYFMFASSHFGYKSDASPLSVVIERIEDLCYQNSSDMLADVISHFRALVLLYGDSFPTLSSLLFVCEGFSSSAPIAESGLYYVFVNLAPPPSPDAADFLIFVNAFNSIRAIHDEPKVTSFLLRDLYDTLADIKHRCFALWVYLGEDPHPLRFNEWYSNFGMFHLISTTPEVVEAIFNFHIDMDRRTRLIFSNECEETPSSMVRYVFDPLDIRETELFKECGLEDNKVLKRFYFTF